MCVRVHGGRRRELEWRSERVIRQDTRWASAVGDVVPRYAGVDWVRDRKSMLAHAPQRVRIPGRRSDRRCS